MTGFRHARPGDTVTRLVAGQIAMRLTVVAVDDTYIYAGMPEEMPHIGREVPEELSPLTYKGWSFDRITGIEEDPELGWGVGTRVTGSYLVNVVAGGAESPGARK